jgi:putative AdoMet-dependent methyltransferase
MKSRFPSSDFDDWAETYDASVSVDQFPFFGYWDVLRRITALAEPLSDLSVLDLGTGTGNLALRFASLGCHLGCIDFSAPMLEKAHQKLPTAHFILHDLRGDWPTELNRPFDRIVSAYVFHHFSLDQKVSILRGLLPYLNPNGRIIIGDIAFQNTAALEKMKITVGDEWEQEFYWLADESLSALQEADMPARYTQVSSCAGVFVHLAKQRNNRR